MHRATSRRRSLLRCRHKAPKYLPGPDSGLSRWQPAGAGNRHFPLHSTGPNRPNSWGHRRRTVMIASRFFRSRSCCKAVRNNARGNGFTLIEILIVVIIISILAAVVIPQLSGVTTQARSSSLQSVVGTVRSEVAVYKLQHGDALPDLTANGGNNWALLTGTTTFNSGTFGPYLQTIPTNPLSNGFLVANGTSSGGFQAGYDYIYDFNSGNGTGNIWGQTQSTTGGVVMP
jgi:general secretion pathway protein G